MTAIRGGPIGPDPAALDLKYRNETDTDRTAWWFGAGAAQGVQQGFAISPVAGQMALDISAGAAMLGERSSAGAATLARGYQAWADTTTRVPFGSATTRNDALVICTVDTEEGAVGTGALANGCHIIAVPGVSGVSTPRSEADINAYIGRGGWLRLADVPIAASETQINVATIVWQAFKINDWNVLSLTLATGWTGLTARRYIKKGAQVTIEITGVYSGATITADAQGNIADTLVASALPSNLIPDVVIYDRFVRNGILTGTWRINTAGQIHVTDSSPSSNIPTGATLTFRAVYYVGQP